MRYVPDGDELDGLPHLRFGLAPAGRPSPACQFGTEPGIIVPPDLAADTATAIALRLVRTARAASLLEGIEAITAAAFSGDHLFAMWALLEPEAALARAGQLDDAARAAEFAVCRSEEATKIACFIRSYPAEAGVQDPAALYRALLPRVGRLVDDPREFDLYWIGDYSDVLQANNLLNSGAVQIEDYPELDLTVIDTPLRLHDLTRMTVAAMFRLLTIRSENTYMLEYRRESWVQFQSRRPLPRVDLRPLAARLNLFERAPGTWRADPVDLPVARLMLDDGRGVASPSTIDAETVRAEVLDFLGEHGRRR